MEWQLQDQRLLSLLFSSLTKEAMAKVLGLTIARDVWLAPWKIPSAIFPRLVSFASKMICNSSNVAPEVLLNILVHSRLYTINSLRWAARLMIQTKFTGISEDWALILLLFLLPRCLSLHYPPSKTWFPKLKAFRFSRSHSGPPPSQNGRAKRKHRHVMETGLALLFQSYVPPRYWVDAFNTATYIINQLPMHVLGSLSPFEVLFGKSPNYENFHPFGCRVYPCLQDYVPHKFSTRSLSCIFLGYSSSHKGFRCFDTTTSRTYIIRHARFDEYFFPFSNTSNATSIADIGFSNFFEPFSLEQSLSTSSSTTTWVPPTPCHFCANYSIVEPL